MHNKIGPAIDNPPANAYTLEITIKGKTYNTTSPLDSEQYELAIYKTGAFYDEYEDREEAQVLIGTEPLHRIATKSDRLITGARPYGWIAFTVHYLPESDTDRKLIGTRIEYDEYEEDGAPIEETSRLEEQYKHFPHTRSVEKLRLTVTDAFGQVWVAEKCGTFDVRDGGF